MKQLIKSFVKRMIFFFFQILSPKLFEGLTLRLNQLYSFWKVNEFGVSGDNVFLRGGKYITIVDNLYSDMRLRLVAWDMHL